MRISARCVGKGAVKRSESKGPTMPKTSVGRTASLLPVLDLLEEVHGIYVSAEESYACLPKQLKSNLTSKGRTLSDDLELCLLFMDPAERRQRMVRIHECTEQLKTIVDAERADGDSGVLYEPEDLEILRGFLRLLSCLRGTRSRREFMRFLEATNSNDLASLVVKSQPGPKRPFIEMSYTPSKVD